jgi:hypothetical protein
MQFFFNTNGVPGQSTITPGSWNYVRDGLERNLKTVKEYYHNRAHAVKSSHLLVRLLTTLGVPYTLNLERFYDIVDGRALQYSMGLKLTSGLYRGAFFRNAFYGGNVLEIVIASTDPVDPYEIYNNWRHADSVRVFEHPKSDLGLLLPNGKMGSTGDGVAVIEVNIPKLAIQFKAFMDDQVRRTSGGMLNPQSTAQFVHTYVLPNMLESHLNIALFNRAYNLLVGAPMSEANMKHPFYLTDFSSQVDKVYSDQLRYLQGNERTFESILETFHGINGSFRETMRLPATPSTRQVVWTELISRLKCWEFLTDIPVSHGRSKNSNTLNQLFREIKRFESDRVLETSLPTDLYYDLEASIDRIRTKIKF